ncbi:hypothetical protein OG976_01635 [Mycobacterium sp. NBC_00419]|uniref:hypothetical protein n=1 Tax=Mycobacterium sp. NBC_00419 TaxID=2975989 RepID=UPI002E22DD8F
MSRTDAHTPYRVRVASREVVVRAVHRCAGRDCDLFDLVPTWSISRIGRCYWEFRFTDGALSSAVAVGNNVHASTNGVLNVASTLGSNTAASAGTTTDDVANVAVSLCDNANSSAGGTFGTAGFGNVAINIGSGDNVTLNRSAAVGLLDMSNNVGTRNQAAAVGVANFANNFGGSDNSALVNAGTALSHPGLSHAFNVFGKGNSATATTGPFAVAGNLLGTGKNTAQSGSGVNIKSAGATNSGGAASGKSGRASST